MTTRTSYKSVTFNRPFRLGNLDEMIPAGKYLIKTEKELLKGVTSTSYRRIETLMHMIADSKKPNLTKFLKINPNELDAALKRDQASLHLPLVVEARLDERGQMRNLMHGATDTRDIERAEDEGMIDWRTRN